MSVSVSTTMPSSIREDRLTPEIVGATQRVPLVTGGDVEYANLDHAASAPSMRAVKTAVDEMLEFYASVHRGSGYCSQVCTRAYDRAREIVAEFCGARPGDSVIFTRNTTDAMNLVARIVPKGTSIVHFDIDHHAALLPWRGPNVFRLATPSTVDEMVEVMDAALRATPVGSRLAVITAAWNVTGEHLPVERLVAVARRHGARVLLDSAQLAPHAPVNLSALDVDYMVLSGHKLYAPFGAGALVGRSDWLRAAPPYLLGGGATGRVAEAGSDLAVAWRPGPERHEAGSPNTVGVHAMAVACQTILDHGWDVVMDHEHRLLSRLRAGLAEVPGLTQLNLFGPEHPRVGVATFAVAGQDSGLLAAVLGAEHGIGVRDGLFCAHIGSTRLLARHGVEGQAIRASVGLGNTIEHVDRLVSALKDIIANGPAWEYHVRDNSWVPVNDPRPFPTFCGSPRVSESDADTDC